MKIIHCGDIHLDSGMERNLSARKARERNGELCAAFARMVRFGHENGVEAVLIAGDLFDSRQVSVQRLDFVLDQIRRAPSMVFYCLRGNHDGGKDAFSGMKLPENLKTFSDCWTSYRQNKVVITGREPEGSSWETMYGELKLDAADCNIVMLHGMEDTRPGRDRIAIPKLRNRNIRYLALGHIHSYKQEILDTDGVFCYCGCLEGRGFDECGEKGFVLLDVQDGRLDAQFVPFAARQLHEVCVDISGLVTVTQIQSALEAAAEDIPDTDLVKFILTGSYIPETQKDLPFLEKMLGCRFWFVTIRDESRLKIDEKDYAHDISLKGEFIRMVMSSDKSEEEKERIICYGLRALLGGEVE